MPTQTIKLIIRLISDGILSAEQAWTYFVWLLNRE